jgi:hypothetical protein
MLLTAHHRHHHVEQHQYDLIVPEHVNTCLAIFANNTEYPYRSNAVLAVADNLSSSTTRIVPLPRSSR